MIIDFEIKEGNRKDKEYIYIFELLFDFGYSKLLPWITPFCLMINSIKIDYHIKKFNNQIFYKK